MNHLKKNCNRLRLQRIYILNQLIGGRPLAFFMEECQNCAWLCMCIYVCVCVCVCVCTGLHQSFKKYCLSRQLLLIAWQVLCTVNRFFWVRTKIIGIIRTYYFSLSISKCYIAKCSLLFLHNLLWFLYPSIHPSIWSITNFILNV